MMMVMSSAGLKALAKEEGEVLEAYQDSGGNFSTVFIGPRSLARSLGKKHYFNGMPCPQGHDGVRATSNATCVDCHRMNGLRWKKNNKKRIRETHVAYYAENKEEINKRSADWVRRNPEKVAEKARRYNTSEKGRFYVKSRNKLRKARSRKATPAWLTPSERVEMRDIYQKRSIIEKTTGEILHVDHIVPLRGDNVSGLHVPWNLRLIDGRENIQKSNKLCEDLLSELY